MQLLVSLGEISSYRDEIETELENSRPKLRGIYAMYAREGTVHQMCLSSSSVYFCKCAFYAYYIVFIVTHSKVLSTVCLFFFVISV